MLKKRKIAINDVRISAKGIKYVLETLKANRLTYGPYAENFERRFARIHNRRFAMITNSGTTALHVALEAFKIIDGWDEGDEVLVPAISFIATSNAVIHAKLKPIFVDVESDYYCIDPKLIEKKITPRTRAIMPVHLFGQSADMKPILSIAKSYNLRILEDSCEAMFVNYDGKPVGSLGDISAFSTYASHIIVTGVGGIVTTNDEAIANVLKSLIFHGRDQIYLRIEDDDKPKNELHLTSLIERRFQFNHVGFSYRLTEMEAALGVAELERRSDIIQRRRKVGIGLTKALSKFSKFLQLPKIRPKSEHIYMLYPILVKHLKVNKENLLSYLEKNGVETRSFMPILSQPIYKRLFGDIENKYEVAKDLVKRGFLIGSHTYISKTDIRYITDLFERFFKYEGLLA